VSRGPARLAPIRVLYIHSVAAFGGASRSLLDLIRAFPPGGVEPRIVAPRGQVAAIFAKEGLPVIAVRGIMKFDCAWIGYWHGWRWIILLRELFYVPFTIWAVLRAHRLWRDVELVHVNEISALLAVALAKIVFRKPVVVHVRSVQRSVDIPLRRRLVDAVMARYADAAIAIDRTVGRSVALRVPTKIIHNGYRQAGTTGEARPRRRFTVGMIGTLMVFKGVSDFLEAARLCIERGNDCDFVLVGDDARQMPGWRQRLMLRLGISHEARQEAERFIASHGLGDRVRLEGFRLDIENVYQGLDVLCFPSHLNAVGRPVIEAAVHGVPSIVAITDPESDTLVHQVTGLAVVPRDHRALAQAIEHMYLHPAECRRMGEAARRLALENFDSRKNAARVLDLYQRVLAGAGSE
jgi:glycosyltransferase involved in cell wall biosynthesis